MCLENCGKKIFENKQKMFKCLKFSCISSETIALESLSFLHLNGK